MITKVKNGQKIQYLKSTNNEKETSQFHLLDKNNISNINNNNDTEVSNDDNNDNNSHNTDEEKNNKKMVRSNKIKVAIMINYTGK